MALSIIPVSRVFGNYEKQARIAELNKKTPVKTVQSQADRVTISAEARQAMEAGVSPTPVEPPKPAVTSSKPAPAPAQAPFKPTPKATPEFKPEYYPVENDELPELDFE